MEGTRIQISIRLLEKLAGVTPEPQAHERRQLQQQQQRLPGGLPGLPRVPLLPAAAPPAFGLDPDVRGALSASRRVGALLLKAEDGELAAVAAAADELLARDKGTPVREVPCRAQEAAVVGCYQRNQAEAWRCAGLVDAYAACSAAAYSGLAG